MARKRQTYQEIISRLQTYWMDYGCVILQPYNSEVGAGTLNPATFLRVLGPEPWNVAYVEPSKRPKDGRYGENPNRVQQFLQYQVILKPPPDNILELYIDSLKHIGVDPRQHDIRLVEDDWEAPTLGASGRGWEVWLDGMEITQFTYFQQAGSLELKPISAEITYGLLRLCLYLQGVDSVMDIEWAKGVTWGEVNRQAEKEFSAFHFEGANTDLYFRLFQDYENEAKRMLERKLVLPAYDYVVKQSHVFNVLDARGAISVTERTGYIGRIRALARKVALQQIEAREALGFPLLENKEDGMSDLLLEIGCENLPPDGIRPAFEQLKKATIAKLEEQRLAYEDVYTTGSPRRLTLIVRGLAASQSARKETVTGPPASRAFDESGKPTPAATGFAKSQDIRIGDLKVIDTPRGEYVGFERTLKKERSPVLLKRIVPELIGGVRFAKTMRWEDGDVVFARPIRWIVCVYGDRVIRFTFAGVASAQSTYTTPWIHKRSIRVRNAGTYLSALKRAGVVLDHDERCALIKQQAERTAKRLGLRLVSDEALFEELTFMLESPHPLVGEFEKQYLKLPKEVVTAAMKSHQRYFGFARGKKLVPKFLTFTEGKVGAPAVVRKGNEKVLRARLADAAFYWSEDLKNGIDGLADKLASIVFVEGLGTLADKADRTARIATGIWRRLEEQEQLSPEVIARASRVSRADLASEMIKDGKEFTLLQGLIGSHYARSSGEDARIVDALAEQYAPRQPSDPLPSHLLGALLSMADRVDTIVGCFLAGIIPSGSQDPYALRRQANGLLRIVERYPELSIAPMFTDAFAAYEAQGFQMESEPEEVNQQLSGFMQQRAESYLKDRGVSYDVVNAVTAAAWTVPRDALLRAEAIAQIRRNAEFEKLITGVKRVGNILEDPLKIVGAEQEVLERAFLETGELASGIRFDRNRFEDDSEQELAVSIKKSLPDLFQADARRDFDTVFAILSRFGPEIDAYFDRVLVNAPDPDLRKNRHHFLAAVYALFGKYADFSRIVDSDPQPRSGA